MNKEQEKYEALNRYLDSLKKISELDIYPKNKKKLAQDVIKTINNAPDHEKELLDSLLAEDESFLGSYTFEPIQEYLKKSNPDEMSITEMIDKIACYNISKLNIGEIVLFYSDKKKEQLRRLLDEGIIDETELENAIEKSIINQAKTSYNILTSKDNKYTLQDIFGENKSLENKAKEYLKESIFQSRLQRPKIYADHIGHEDCLAYAIENNVFSKRQLKKIPFDHDETPETYSEIYGIEDIVSRYKDKITTPKENQQNYTTQDDDFY